MKRAVSNAVDTLGSKMATHVSVFGFELLNLCIKAEEASLIPVQVNVEGESKNLEDVATVGKKDDYTFWIIPTYDDDIESICQGVSSVHPEFKQSFTTVTVESCDVENMSLEDKVEKEMKVIVLEMPEVNDDRYDALKDGVDLCYKQCQASMDASVAKAYATIAYEGIGDSPEDLDQAKEAVEQIKQYAEEQRDKIRDKKLKDIEEAYQKWLSVVEGNTTGSDSGSSGSVMDSVKDSGE